MVTRLVALAATAVVLLPAAADRLILPDSAFEQVIVTESDRAFYVRIPEDGTVQPVPKETLAGEVRVVIADDNERNRLHEAWRQKFTERRDAARAARKEEAAHSEAVKERRDLGQRMAEEDVQRIAARDRNFDRQDLRWRRHDADEQVLKLLLSGEDDSTIQLAAMAADSQLINQFVNMRLVDGVKQSWLRQGWNEKANAERDKALAVVTAVVKREAKTSIERDATMAYIQRHVEEWE